MPLGRAVLIIGWTKHQQRTGRNSAFVLPAMWQVSIEEQAVAWLQHKSLFINHIGQLTFQAEDNLASCMHHQVFAAVGMRIERDQEGFSASPGQSRTQVLKHSVGKIYTGAQAGLIMCNRFLRRIGFKESSNGHLQSKRQYLQGFQARRVLAVFDHAERIDVKPAFLCQVANGKTAFCP